ncbi:MAG TPA: imidazole glycerol phosphate synthase subunit HisH [Candidatus Acidoferrales bacterium]
MKVSIVDYGAGNLPSVERALAVLGAATERASEARQISNAQVLVLPGVGHFSAFVAGLRARKLEAVIRDAHARAVPILGICLGLQAFFVSSHEAPNEAGLGFLDGDVRSLPERVKSPHLGWNQVRTVKIGRLLRGVAADAHFYFAHSFAAPVNEYTAAACDHGFPFAAVIEFKNLFGVQFHPEKSGATGSRVLRNFLDATR